MEYIDLCIIGAGISGIAVAKQAKLYNIPFVILEKCEFPIGVWRYKSYPNIKLQTSKYDYSFKDEPMKDGVSDYPIRDEIIDYFENIIDKYDIRSKIRYRCNVLNIIPKVNDKPKVNDSSRFNYHIIKYHNGSTTKWIKCSYISICSGFYTEPKWPKNINNNNFRGRITHVRDYAIDRIHTQDTFKDKHVLVIGNGPSGCDISTIAKDNGAKTVHIIYRSPRWIFPHYILSIGSHHLINKYTVFFSRKIPKKILLFLIKVLFRLVYLIIGLKYSLKLPDSVISRQNYATSSNFLKMLNQHGPGSKHDNQTVFYQQIDKKSLIHFYHKKADYITNDGGHISIPCDTVICATGYYNDIDFFPTKIPPLYKRIVPVYDSSISFIGFSASFNWSRVSDAQARWWIKHIVGLVNIPSIENQQKDIRQSKEACFTKDLSYEDLSYEVYSYLDTLEKDELFTVN